LAFGHFKAWPYLRRGTRRAQAYGRFLLRTPGEHLVDVELGAYFTNWRVGQIPNRIRTNN